jgi:hypothetical protein
LDQPPEVRGEARDPNGTKDAVPQWRERRRTGLLRRLGNGRPPVIFLEVEACPERASLARTYLDQSEAGQGQCVNNSEGRGRDPGRTQGRSCTSLRKAVTRLIRSEGGVFPDLRREPLAREDRRRRTVARTGHVCFTFVRWLGGDLACAAGSAQVIRLRLM